MSLSFSSNSLRVSIAAVIALLPFHLPTLAQAKAADVPIGVNRAGQVSVPAVKNSGTRFDPRARALLEHMSTAYKHLHSLQTDVQIINSGEDEPTRKITANFAFLRPNKARLEVQNGEGKTFAITNGTSLWYKTQSTPDRCLLLPAKAGWQAIRQVLDVNVVDKHGATSNIIMGSAYFDGTLINLSASSKIGSVTQEESERINGCRVDCVLIVLSAKDPVATLRFAIGCDDRLLRRLTLDVRNGTTVVQHYEETYSNVKVDAISRATTFAYVPNSKEEVVLMRPQVSHLSLKIGQLPPVIEGTDLNGNFISLPQFLGKVVLLDFWATWCAPCVADLPNMRNRDRRLRAEGLTLIGISLDHDKNKLQGFVQSHQVLWPNLLDSPPKIINDYGVTTIPYTVLIGRDGRVATFALRGVELDAAIKIELAKPLSARN